MKRSKRRLVAAVAVLVLASLPPGCSSRTKRIPLIKADKKPCLPKTVAVNDKDVLATVNGRPITRQDLEMLRQMRMRSHKGALSAAQKKALLDRIVQQELIAQAAEKLGLDKKSKMLQKALAKQRAQLDLTRRKALSNLYFRTQIAAKLKVEKSEAKAYFEKHKERLRTEIRVLQIRKRSEDDAKKALAAIKGGKSFDEVAKADFKKLPNQRPWDRGWLTAAQVPPSWKAVYALKKGQLSKVLRGRASRYWVLKLLDRRVDKTATYEKLEPQIMAGLKRLKLHELRSKSALELKKGAKIVYRTATP